MPLRVMIDTMVFDELVAGSAARQAVDEAVAAGRIVLVTSHVQRDQLDAGAPDAVKAVAGDLRLETVPTSGAVWGVSRWGEADWGDGTAASVTGLMIGNPRHAEDALIGATAAAEADVLVTQDKPFARRVRAAATMIEVCDLAGLLRILAAVDTR